MNVLLNMDKGFEEFCKKHNLAETSKEDVWLYACIWAQKEIEKNVATQVASTLGSLDVGALTRLVTQTIQDNPNAIYRKKT